MSSGSDLMTSVLLTASNFAFVASGFALYRKQTEEHRTLRRTSSVLYMFYVCLASAAAATVIAGLAGSTLLPNLFKDGLLSGMTYWMPGELLSGILVLPLVLATQRLQRAKVQRRAHARREGICRRAAPMLTVPMAVVAAMVFDGPGTIAFTVQTLLWCALVYRMLTTILPSTVVCIWQLTTSSASAASSIATVALGHWTVAVVNAARIDALRQLRHTLDHDGLTGALSPRRVPCAELGLAGRRTVRRRRTHVRHRSLQTCQRHSRPSSRRPIAQVFRLDDRSLAAGG